jgi:hypothetical protein
MRERSFNHSKRFRMSDVLWPGVARHPVTFLASPRKVTKEKATPFAGLRLPLANSLKPGNAETRFAIIAEEAKLEHPHCCAKLITAPT